MDRLWRISLQAGRKQIDYFMIKRLLTHSSATSLLNRTSVVEAAWVHGRCAACLQLQQVSSLHNSGQLNAGKMKNTKRKLVRPVTFSKKKSISSTWDVVAIRNNMTVREIAATLNKDTDHVFEVLCSIKGSSGYDEETSVIDNLNVIKDICNKSGFRWKMETLKKAVIKENKDVYNRPAPNASDLTKRPPVVTIMGHVDHGKTTLLDALRNSSIVDGEFGGITQHIGAFSVKLPSGEAITFLDTPGHAAFSAMRERGAQVTDIVVLVVDANDGVMKQTLESIRYAQEANVPMIVAINKIDLPDADIKRTKRMLMQHGVMLEDHGGDVQCVPISALKGENLDLLQEAIVTQAELLELVGQLDGLVEGAVIEAKTDPGRGKLATILVQRGTLEKGACLVAGSAWAKVRNLFDDQGRVIRKAPPATAVEVIGWKDLPSAGDQVLQVDNEAHAREVVGWRQEQDKDRRASEDSTVIEQKATEHREVYRQIRQANLDRGIRRGAIFKKMKRKEAVVSHIGPELALVIKGDVDGSVEAILDVLASYRSDQCRLHLLHYGVGAVSEQDVEMAASFSGHVYAFNVPCGAKVAQAARAQGVDIHSHNVIYRMVDDLKDELTKRVPSKQVEEIIGEAQVLQPFTVSEGRKKVPVAGSRCVKGLLDKSKTFKLIRDGETLIDGELSSLKHFKKEVDTIKLDSECGISFQDRDVEAQIGDTIVCYHMVDVEQTIEWDLDF